MFEDRTYEKIMEEVLIRGEELGVDIRQGSIFYDAVSGTCAKIAMFYADLKSAIDLVFVETAVGEYLDLRGREFNLVRNPATPAIFHFEYEGTRPQVGERFFAEGYYFTLIEEDNTLLLEADVSGVKENSIIPGTSAVPVNNISGLTSASFGNSYDFGTDAEDDESYRQRLREKIAGPAENGNRQHYKTWCEEIPGVGRARIIPLFAGENTVMGVVIGQNGLPADKPLVERVQEHIDPITMNVKKEYENELVTVGDGLGNGTANIGAHFLAVSAKSFFIKISFKATLSEGITKEQIVEKTEEAIKDYFKSIALSNTELEKLVIRISKVGAILYDLEGLIDYENLTFNGMSSNIELTDKEVPILLEVDVYV